MTVHNKGPTTTDRSTPQPANRGYQWTCPYCSETRFKPAETDLEQHNAIAALRAHVMASDGADHGPVNELPDENLAFTDHITYIDEVD